MCNIDKFRGCLIAGAAGDALGYAVEFKREAEIFAEAQRKMLREEEQRAAKQREAEEHRRADKRDN